MISPRGGGGAIYWATQDNQRGMVWAEKSPWEEKLHYEAEEICGAPSVRKGETWENRLFPVGQL